VSRDHRKLRVFHDAHALVLHIYKQTQGFPREEWYGIRQQIRRAAVSVPTNIVEGSARLGPKEYCNFLNMALGSACEVAYLVTLAGELGFVTLPVSGLVNQSESVVRQLKRLVAEAEMFAAQSPKPKAQKSPPRR